MDDNILLKHFIDLSVAAERRNLHKYSGFLNLPEQDILQRGKREYSVPFETYGGFEGAERVVAAFGGADCYDEPEYPISVVVCEPLNERFATELTHRDYLGAIMGTGLLRDRIGDIVINGKTALIYCISEIADYIADNLTSVGKTQVKCCVKKPSDVDNNTEKHFEKLIKSLASERMDAAVAELVGCSRGAATEYIAAAKVFLNQRECTSNSAKIKPGDVISVRGLGKFRYDGIEYVGKKGTLHVAFSKYV